MTDRHHAKRSDDRAGGTGVGGLWAGLGVAAAMVLCCGLPLLAAGAFAGIGAGLGAWFSSPWVIGVAVLLAAAVVAVVLIRRRSSGENHDCCPPTPPPGADPPRN